MGIPDDRIRDSRRKSGREGGSAVVPQASANAYGLPNPAFLSFPRSFPSRSFSAVEPTPVPGDGVGVEMENLNCLEQKMLGLRLSLLDVLLPFKCTIVLHDPEVGSDAAICIKVNRDRSRA
jgi:hypothetical protein